MTERDSAIGAVSATASVTPSRSVHPHVGREQIDLFDLMLEHGEHAVSDPPVELVATLTEDEIHQIEAQLPAGSTVPGILGRALDYRPASASRRTGHAHPADGHVDADA